jgi:hypothetical protein
LTVDEIRLLLDTPDELARLDRFRRRFALFSPK